jgi:peptidoglycan-associated lipoprotein
MHKRTIGVLVFVGFMAIAVSACKKKVAVAAPPPPPPPPPVKEAPAPPKAPVISAFIAEPNSIERGQSTTLRWTVSNATEASINPAIGTVAMSGNQQAFPSTSTTYTLTVKGPGGTASANAMVGVTIPRLPLAAVSPKKTITERLNLEVQDAFFDYDKSNVRENARVALSSNATALRAIFRDFPNATVVLEGHCDERGSAQYNLALADRRANEAKEFLTTIGVRPEQLKLITYGKERPQCTEANEDCWQKNRRVHFVSVQ